MQGAPPAPRLATRVGHLGRPPGSWGGDPRSLFKNDIQPVNVQIRGPCGPHRQREGAGQGRSRGRGKARLTAGGKAIVGGLLLSGGGKVREALGPPGAAGGWGPRAGDRIFQTGQDDASGRV